MIFDHDIGGDDGADHLWHDLSIWGFVNESVPERFSLLDKLETFRRPSDGQFEFKVCYPDSRHEDEASGYEYCTHWIQRLSPFMNPTSTNMHIQCVDCPYDDDDEFMGIMYNGDDCLFDGHGESNAC